MTQVIKMAPNRREGQEGIERLEERMHFVLGQIGECDRILRRAREAEARMKELRNELLDLTGEYGTFTAQKEGA